MAINQNGKLQDQSDSYAVAGEAWDAERQAQLYKRTLIIVVLAQMFGGAGLAAGVTVGALLAEDMLGTASYAGVPAALMTVGAAATAFGVGRLSQRFSRRAGLTIGFTLGGIGALGVIAAAQLDHVGLLFASLLIYGAGTATNLLARYAGTDLAKPSQRATAVSAAMVATTFGAVAGPNLVDKTGQLAASIGIPVLTGPFLLAAVAFLLAGLIIWISLRPDPLVIAKAIAAAQPSQAAADAAAPPSAGMKDRRGVIVGATVMVLTQIVMVAVMTMTPIHMMHHGHGLGAVGFVISVHIGAMYVPSLFTGVLTDKIGRIAMAVIAGVILLASGLLAAAAPADSIVLLTLALALLGLGWNSGLISGTTLIVDATPPSTRAKTQGTLDVLIALAGASGGALSGIVVAQSSFAALSLAGGALALLLIPVMFWYRRGR